MKAVSPVWVDAICINQADLKERESQVKIMRDIYKHAAVTVVWHGGTIEQSAKVFDTMNMLHEAYQYPDFQKLLRRDELDFGVLDHISIGDTKLQILWDNREEIGRFFSHPWFERIWICQEVAVSNETFVYYGGRIRPWSYIVSTAYCMQRLHWEHSSIGSMDSAIYANALQIEGYRLGTLNGSGLRLLDLLTESRQFRSSEPLDRVFGLYGLIGDTKEKGLVESFFDYQLSPLDVFLNITLNLIVHHQTLDVLHLTNNDPKFQEKWLSFVPNFAGHNTSRQMGSRKGRHDWEYHAARDTEPRLNIDRITPHRNVILRAKDTTQISLSGFIVDEISRVENEMVDMGFNCGVFLKDWFMLALMDDGEKFYTSEEINKAQEYKKSLMQAQLLPETESQDASQANTSTAVVAANRTRKEKNPPPDVDPTLLEALDNMILKQRSESEDYENIEGVEKDLPQQGVFHPSFKYPIQGIAPVSAFWRTLIHNRDGSGSVPDASIASSHFMPWLRACFGGMGAYLKAWYKDHHALGPRPVPAFNEWVVSASIGSKILRSKNNFIGTGSNHIEPGDLICVLYGGQTPFVLRREESGKFRFIGDCYVHGIMEGEALDMDLEEMEFLMV